MVGDLRVVDGASCARQRVQRCVGHARPAQQVSKRILSLQGLPQHALRISLGNDLRIHVGNAQARAFAFDGTVVSIGERPTGTEEADPYVPVNFTVSQWFRGGNGDKVTVAMFPPVVHTSADNASYAVGSRLLVSGEDRWGSSRLDNPIAWACGFTRWYNRTDAQTWKQAFR